MEQFPMSAKHNEEWLRSLERSYIPEWLLEIMATTSIGLFVFVVLFWAYLLIGD
jgi:hypothetical protein